MKGTLGTYFLDDYDPTQLVNWIRVRFASATRTGSGSELGLVLQKELDPGLT